MGKYFQTNPEKNILAKPFDKIHKKMRPHKYILKSVAPISCRIYDNL